MTEGAVASVFDGQYTGLALREETIVTSPGTGYVNFFVGDATPISVGEQTYILDGSGKIASKLEEAAKNQAILSEDNLNQIKDTIHDFDTSFDSQNYYDVYSFKYRIESQMLDLINGSVFENINNELSEMGENTYQIVSSDISGVVMHNIDGYEGKTTDQIESSDFKKSNYQKQIIKTNDLIAEGDPVYKVITSETWKLVIQIDDASVFEEKPYVNIEFLKDNINKIKKKSGDVLLLPIGADHLGVETDLTEQISQINERLEDYEIKIGTIFEYIKKVKDRFLQYEVNTELRDNSKTFILEGCYSSRTDIKRYNITASHRLNLAESLAKYYEKSNYFPLLEYAYKLLLQNQAHDSICGCSTDDVHSENITRYKKILQIADTIIDEVALNGKDDKIINLSDKEYSGVIEFD